MDRLLTALEGAVIGIVAGAVICSFRLCLYTAAPFIARHLSGWQEHWWKPVLWLCIIVFAARLLGFMVQRFPLISGSGIPQTELAITGRLHLSRHIWLTVLPCKFISCLISALAGLSLGRAAPCIQMGAASASLVSGLWDHISPSGRIHLAAGAAAGLSAAFGAPLAGLFFAFEELGAKPTLRGFLTICAAVSTSQIVTLHVFAFGPIFPFSSFPLPEISDLWLLPVTGIATGLAGALYNKALISTKNAEAAHTPLPQDWRILPPILVGFVLALTCPAVLGGGEGLIASLASLPANPESMLGTILLLVVLKVSFSLVSYTGNVPGGILMPILCMGALTGALAGQSFLHLGLVGPDGWQPFILYGMTGFFSASIRTPLAGTALALETTGAVLLLPPVAAVAFIASITADLLRSEPIYASMRAAIVVPRRR